MLLLPLSAYIVLALIVTQQPGSSSSLSWKSFARDGGGGGSGGVGPILSIILDNEFDYDASEAEESDEPPAAERQSTERPIIGILAQELSTYLNDHLPRGHNYTRNLIKTYKNFHRSGKVISDSLLHSYIAASYIKFVESAGARAVPILINKSDEYYERMFKSLNGVLYPGGAVPVSNSAYGRSASKFFELARAAYDSTGDIFPIWGTCLGFEMLAYLGNDYVNPLDDCSSNDMPSKLDIFSENGWRNSSLGSDMPSDVRDTLTTSAATINFHHFCLTPKNFTSNNMGRFFLPPLATSVDNNGMTYVALLESRRYPMWACQFHPEKTAYEWTLKHPKTPHDAKSIHANNYFAEFFVQAARQSKHKFASRAEEERHLIYNYSPVYTGAEQVDYTMVQCYLFRDDD